MYRGKYFRLPTNESHRHKRGVAARRVRKGVYGGVRYLNFGNYFFNNKSEVMNTKIKKEKWLPIWYTNAKYRVSNFGRVMSVYTMSKYGVIRLTGTILTPSINRNGYATVKIKWIENGVFIKKTKKVHRLVCEAFHKNPEKKPEVNHKDLNKLNNFFRNLEWATPKENTNHAQINGARPLHKKQYVKKGFANCYKPIIDFNTGIFYTSEELAFVLGTEKRYVNRLLSGERKPNNTQYQYANNN